MIFLGTALGITTSPRLLMLFGFVGAGYRLPEHLAIAARPAGS